MRLIIGGDIKPTQRDLNLFIEGRANQLWGDTIDEIKNTDFSIANLETPIIKNYNPIEKTGGIFGSPEGILNSISKSGISFLNLANNHILDHGGIGLETTIEALQKYGFEFSGAGKNIKDASKPYVKKIGDKKIGILTYAEHEFSIAGHSSAGANPLDIIDFIDKVKVLKIECDFIILLYHGGKENYSLPTPNQQRLCRFFIKQGVNIVVCQHSHTAGAYEELYGGVIFYGQGNFLFDPKPIKKDWLYKGFLIDLKINSDDSFDYKLLPYIHNSFEGKKSGIRLMRKDESDIFINKINYLNEQMNSNPDFIDNEWRNLSLSLKNTYLSILNGNGRILRKLNERFSFLNIIYKNDKKLLLKNLISCETHREIIQTFLNND